VEPVLDRTKHGRYLALLRLQAPYHATLIPHLKLIVAQLGFGQPGGVYGEVCLDHITFDREYAMKVLGLEGVSLL
jgi:hypothetical protein